MSSKPRPPRQKQDRGRHLTRTIHLPKSGAQRVEPNRGAAKAAVGQTWIPSHFLRCSCLREQLNALEIVVESLEIWIPDHAEKQMDGLNGKRTPEAVAVVCDKITRLQTSNELCRNRQQIQTLKQFGGDSTIHYGGRTAPAAGELQVR